MKKRTIWTIAVIMGLTFVGLIYTQMRYFEEIVEARQEQFNGDIGRVLFRISHDLELKETRNTIEQEIVITDSIHKRQQHDDFTKLQDSLLKLANADSATLKERSLLLKKENAKAASQEKIRQRFLHQKELLNEAIYAILYKPADKEISQRIDFTELDRSIQAHLKRRNIDLKYHFMVTTFDGRELYRCPDYEEPGNAKVYQQVLFQNDPPTQHGIIKIHFPHTGRYIFATVKFLIPALIFTFILLVVFIYSIWIIFRQKRLTEMKTDFINNMTHEFKTPISSISLAAQMLSDTSVPKSETMLKHLAGIITDESKRLRFQVDKVLQTSLFEKGKATTFKFDELDANAIIEEVASTFTLKVHNVGGTIDTQLDAEDPIIFADQMHFTNVIFNLLDNAVKYRRQDAKDEKGNPINLHLNIRTANENNRLKIYISDNGIGIKKENLKRIFDRFYRVSTGNRHDVKGFGLGLAYVTSVVEGHKGNIRAESVFGQGTTFIITLPLMEA